MPVCVLAANILPECTRFIPVYSYITKVRLFLSLLMKFSARPYRDVSFCEAENSLGL